MFYKSTAVCKIPDTSCATSSNKPQLFIKMDSSSISSTYFHIDTLHGKLYCTVSGASQNVYIRYKVFVDCSILSETDSSNSVNLVQLFVDTLNKYSFNIDSSGTNTSTYTGLSKPNLNYSVIGSGEYTINYLESNFITLAYQNSTPAKAKIKFRFNAGDTTLCGHGKIITYQYKTTAMGSYASFTPSNNTSVTVSPYSYLYIKETVTDTNCRTSPCRPITANLQWHAICPMYPTHYFAAHV